MPECRECGYQNKEGNKYCVNCGGTLESKEALTKKEMSRQATSTRNYIAYFFIFMGFCTLFGGLMTYATSVGTIIQSMSAQVSTPFILVGFVLMAIGFGVLMVKTEVK
jgi:uncharacterized membrane protein YvbJ